MSGWSIGALRAVIVVALAGSVVVQAGVLALLWLDSDGAPTGTAIALAVIGVLGVLML